MQKTIEFYRKQVYAKTYFYVKDETLENIWQSLSGHKTITQEDIILCGRLFGAEFKEVLVDTAIHAKV